MKHKQTPLYQIIALRICRGDKRIGQIPDDLNFASAIHTEMKTGYMP